MLPSTQVVAPETDFAFPIAMLTVNARGFRADHGDISFIWMDLGNRKRYANETTTLKRTQSVICVV